MACENWFETWFDSPYYHLLYSHRDLKEALNFTNFINRYFQKAKKSNGEVQKLIDVGCGKGRHSYHFQQLGYDVTGIDLSEKSIAEARQMENKHLHFMRQDMRQPFGWNTYDFAVNLFTSFGYFENDEDEITVLQNIYNSLKSDGIFVFDYFNPQLVSKIKCINEIKNINEIKFEISKKLHQNKVVKKIKVSDNGKTFHFEENVKLIGFEFMQKALLDIGFTLRDVYGGYFGEPYNSETERMIIVAKK